MDWCRLQCPIVNEGLCLDPRQEATQNIKPIGLLKFENAPLKISLVLASIGGSITYWHDVASQKLQGIRSRDEQVHFLSQARPLWGFHDRFQIKVSNLLWKEWISDASMTQHTLYAWVYRNTPRNSRLKIRGWEICVGTRISILPCIICLIIAQQI